MPHVLCSLARTVPCLHTDQMDGKQAVVPTATAAPAAVAAPKATAAKATKAASAMSKAIKICPDHRYCRVVLPVKSACKTDIAHQASFLVTTRLPKLVVCVELANNKDDDDDEEDDGCKLTFLSFDKDTLVYTLSDQAGRKYHVSYELTQSFDHKEDEKSQDQIDELLSREWNQKRNHRWSRQEWMDANDLVPVRRNGVRFCGKRSDITAATLCGKFNCTAETCELYHTDRMDD